MFANATGDTDDEEELELKRLELSMVIENVDFSLLSADDGLFANFSDAVAEALAANLEGVSGEDLRLVLSEGSVAVNASLPALSPAVASSLQAQALAQAASIAALIVASLSSLPGIDTVTTGVIQVTGFLVIVVDDAGTSTTTSPGPVKPAPLGSGSAPLSEAMASFGGITVAAAFLLCTLVCLCALCRMRRNAKAKKAQEAEGSRSDIAQKPEMASAFDPSLPFAADGDFPLPLESVAEGMEESGDHDEAVPHEELHPDDVDTPGRYEIIKDFTAVGSSAALGGPTTAELKVGMCVDVVEVIHVWEDKRVRGRILYPHGWISLRCTARGDNRRWARRISDIGGSRPARGDDSRVSSPSQASGTTTQPPAPRTPLLLNTGLGLASPQAATPPSPPGFEATPELFKPSSPARSRMSPSPKATLPGGLTAGDRVTSLVAYAGSAGAVASGDIGIVMGPCKDYNGSSALERVNCKFPRHHSINLLHTQIKRLGGSLEDEAQEVDMSLVVDVDALDDDDIPPWQRGADPPPAGSPGGGLHGAASGSQPAPAPSLGPLGKSTAVLGGYGAQVEQIDAAEERRLLEELISSDNREAEDYYRQMGHIPQPSPSGVGQDSAQGYFHTGN